jgi:hypothetical protein
VLMESRCPALNGDPATGHNSVQRKRDTSNKTPGRKQGKKLPFSQVRLRMREIERIMRFLLPIPPDKLVIFLTSYARCLFWHLREIGRPSTDSAIVERLEIMGNLGPASYATKEQLETAVELALKHPRLEKADELGRRFEITYAVRTFLKLKTIGCCDKTKVQRTRLRKARKRERDRLRSACKRAERGAMPRAQWLENSKTRTKPWEQEGKSRATYYRSLKKHHDRASETGPSPNDLSIHRATHLSHSFASPLQERILPNESLSHAPRVAAAPERGGKLLHVPRVSTTAERGRDRARERSLVVGSIAVLRRRVLGKVIMLSTLGKTRGAHGVDQFI